MMDTNLTYFVEVLQNLNK